MKSFHTANINIFLTQIAKTTLSSKILAQHKDFFAELAVDAVLRLRGSANLDAIQIIKKTGGTLRDSFLDEGQLAKMLIVSIFFTMSGSLLVSLSHFVYLRLYFLVWLSSLFSSSFP